MPRTYKKVKECPRELGELIEILNLLPEDSEKFEEELHKLGSRFVKEAFIEMDDGYEFLNHVANVSEKCLDDLRKLIPLKLAEKYSEQFDVADFRDAREFFGSLADEKTTLKDILDSFHFYQHDEDVGFTFKKPIKFFNFNKDSTLTVSGFHIVEILMKHKIPLTRLRVCPICKNFFWAKKLNSETCGNKKCIDDLGNRKRLAEAKSRKEHLDNHFQSRIKKR